MLRENPRPIIEAAAIAALGVAGVLVQHARRGVEMHLFALAVILVGPAFQRWLLARARSKPLPPVLLAFELAAFAGFAVHPFSLWGLALASAPGLFLALPRRPDPGSPTATWVEKAVVAGLALAASAAAWLALRHEIDAHLWLLAGAALLLEAFGPDASWSTADAGRRAASFALVVGWSLVAIQGRETWLAPHPAKDACFVLGALALLAGWTSWLGPRTTDSTPSLRRLVRIAFTLSVAVNVLLLVLHPFLPGLRETVPLANPHRVEGHEVTLSLPAHTALETSDDFVLEEDGSPLPLPGTLEAEVASKGMGRYDVATRPWVPGLDFRSGSGEARFALWSSRDGSDPLTNGRVYTLVIRSSAAASLGARLAVFLCGCLGLLAWRLGVLDATHASPRAQRIALVLLTAASLGAAFARTWNEVLVVPDSGGYVRHHPVRPLLYPAFIDAFASSPVTSETGALTSPLLNVARAQKVFTVLSVSTLVFVFSEFLSVWLVAGLLYLAAFTEIFPMRLEGSRIAASSVLSEGINHGLIYLAFAALFAVLSRPSWGRRLALPLVLALLVLNRPSNVVFALALGVVWLADQQRSGWRRASFGAAVLALVLAVPLVIACAVNAAHTGRFKLHADSGPMALCPALLIAAPDEAEHFEDDPALARFVAACLADKAWKRLPDYDPQVDPVSANDAINTNLYRVATPAFARTIPVAPGDVTEHAYREDEVYAAVARRIVARHPGEYLTFVARNVSCAVTTYYLRAVYILALAAGLFAFARSRAALLLGFLFLATIPFLAMVPACLVQCPLERYHSQFAFAETLTGPLLLALLATLGPSVFAKRALKPS